MTRALLVPALAIVAVAAPASAGTNPSYAELPTSQVAARPAASSRPKSIAARETIPGLKTRLTTASYPGEERVAMVTFETATGKPAMKVADFGGCLSLGRASSTEWDAPVEAESHHAPKTGVVPIRAEKLVESADGTARLEITDAWFDTRSRGLRAIGKSTLALKTYSTIPGGSRIYAGRDEHGGKKYVQFVVTEGKDVPAHLLMSQHAPVTRLGTETKTDRLGICGHHHYGVLAGSGESISLELKALLPSLGPNERANVVSDLPPLTDQDRQAGLREGRTRTVRIHLGTSQTSRDKEPIVSVSAEWASNEQIERLYERDLSSFGSRIFHVDTSDEDAALTRSLF